MDASECPAGRLHGYAAMLNQSDVFVVLSAAAAVLAFGINLTQALVILCLVWRSWKCAYHLALSLCGLLSAAALLWHVVALRMPDDHGGWRAGCGAIPSALSVALLIGYVAHVTAPVVHRCVADTWPRAFTGHARNRGLCVLLSGFACRRRPQQGGADVCTLPHPWSSAFSTFVCALYALHVVVDLAVLVDMTAAAMRKSRAVAAPQPLPTIAAAADSACRRAAADDDDDFFGEGGCSSLNRVDLGPLWSRFVLLLVGTLPMIGIMFYHMISLPPSSSSGGRACPSFRDVLPLWTLLCTVVLGVALPVGSVSSDPVVAEGSVHIIRLLCCFSGGRGGWHPPGAYERVRRHIRTTTHETPWSITG
ncbi:hypothetical protein HPB49_017888 [Dermacentor silvarum]|uniref:Uncharacterized protein n=1 Tax=Dermacentor silvarum TaxID=543639 RepID=A0ACB8DE89_DERSI|nr:hypothetical protein HPB49_017888 [Dermacentor silvarum]